MFAKANRGGCYPNWIFAQLDLMFAQSLCLCLYIWTWNIGCKTRKTLKNVSMIIYDLILVCGSNLKPLHSGEKIAVWVQILSFRWRCYRQDLTPGYSFSLHCMGWESWDPGGGLVGRLSATSSSRRQCDGGGGADLNTCDCRLHFPSVRGKIMMVM